MRPNRFLELPEVSKDIRRSTSNLVGISPDSVSFVRASSTNCSNVHEVVFLEDLDMLGKTKHMKGTSALPS